ncbi:MAG TPA: S8/S53 family peptidase [bacterium]|jgi:subtilisin family serine protease
MLIRRLPALSALALLLMVCTAHAADDTARYWVYLRDKGLSPAERQLALQQAEQTLTPRALARRIKNHVPLADNYDLPVSARYVEQIRSTGARIRTVSPWLNAVSIEATPQQFAAIREMDGVQTLEQFHLRKTGMNEHPTRAQGTLDDPNYGLSLHQYAMSHIPELHHRGLSGRGVLICFLDTGYELYHRAFDSLHVVAKYDFIHRDTTVQDVAGEDSAGQSGHGTGTLSVCGGYRDSMLVGPAFGADFLCAKTEWVPTETHAEEDYYVEALHWADSLGADITSSSLGYIGEAPDFWYPFPDLNGHTATTTRGLEVAAAHGILCVTAAGNERFSSWNHIVTPADADSILAVGAVDTTGEIAGFSSPGPTGDGRIKPDISAQGTWVLWAEAHTQDNYGFAAGTSLSTPIVSGAAALIMEAHPTWTAQMVRHAMMQTASMADSANNDFGWGIMNALAAADYIFDAVPVTPNPVPNSPVLLSTYPNPVNGTATLTLTLPSNGSGRLTVYDVLGREAFTWPQTKWAAGEQHLALNTEGFTTGIYFVRFEGTAGHAIQKMVILK